MNMKKIVLGALVVAGLLGLNQRAVAGEGSGTKPTAEARVAKKQTACPVSGKAIDASSYVDYKGKRVYFCSAGSAEKFKADPEKYMKKLAEEGIELAPAPAVGGSGSKPAAESRPKYQGSGSK